MTNTNEKEHKSPYLTLQIPLLVAKITIGDNELSKARFRYEKHSISSICTCPNDTFLIKTDGGAVFIVSQESE